MRIEHASLYQVQKGRDGRKVLVEDDVLDVVRQLQEIHPSLFVNYNEQGDYFTVVENCADGVERIVTTVKELDQRVVEHIRSIDSHRQGWDVGAEIARQDRQAKKDLDHAFAERLGEAGERLVHALKKDLQWKNRIWLPRGITR